MTRSSSNNTNTNTNSNSNSSTNSNSHSTEVIMHQQQQQQQQPADHPPMDEQDESASSKNDKNERLVRKSRVFVYFILLVLAVIGTVTTFLLSVSEERDDGQQHAETVSEAIANAATTKSASIIQVFHSAAETISLQHHHQQDDGSSFITIPQFEGALGSTRDVTEMRAIIFAPTVVDSQEWQTYAEDSYASWSTHEDDRIMPYVYDIASSNKSISKQTASPLVPAWQIAPFPNDNSHTIPFVNGNLRSEASFNETYNVVEASQQHGISKAIPSSTVWKDLLFASAQDGADHGPFSFFVQPALMPSSDEASNQQKQLVGVLTGLLLWEDFFQGFFHDETFHGEDSMVVLTYDQESYTYRISGDKATFVGKDHHDPSVNMDKSYVIRRSLHLQPYTITVYPTRDLLESHQSAMPWLFGLSILAVFVVASLGFLFYDKRVEAQQDHAREHEQRRKAVADTLFPTKEDSTNERQTFAFTRKSTNMSDDDEIKSKEEPVFRLTNFQNDMSIEENDLEDEDPPKSMNDSVVTTTTRATAANMASSNPVDSSKPIADLFPNTTVMFADISGFTAWSSVREPSQVFTLLETVYHGFDRNAQRRDVFKVETVGDCYVAVAGLPEPNKAHAVVMCKFARDCVTLFTHLVSRLEVLLGPDTAELGIRVGLHSGPVTAGVLRGGSPSRFQLFGDTVNTAARIETTGSRNRIHISHDTAELLHADGHSNWVRKRTTTIVAKGKGELQTFWLLTNSELKDASNASNQDDGATMSAAPLPLVRAIQPRLAKNGTGMCNDDAPTLAPKIKRLVEWNVDVLTRLLQKIEAKRVALKANGDTFPQPAGANETKLSRLEKEISQNNFVLNEVQEIITLPTFNKDAKFEGNPNKIQLPKEVEDQLRLYVSSIAAMHRENPFHNFEHASHVMMSVSKLLSRIVAPAQVDNQEASTLHDHTYGITSDPLTQFAVVLAALVHDVDHSGVSNFQLIKEKSKIATVFNNKSVAEQNSIVLAWESLMEPRFLPLRRYIYSDPSEARRFRALMVNTVLATDIFDKELQTLRKSRWDKAFQLVEAASAEDTEIDDRNRKATIVLEHLIQASDVAHTMQHWHVYQKWNERLFGEMTVAFRSDRMGKDPAVGWYEGELGFFDNYIIPLAKKLKECGVFGVSSDEYLNYALENRKEWAVKGQQIVETMIEKFQEVGE